jgi:hypothetical protein
MFGWMADFPRCEVLYHFEYPTDPMKVHVAVAVETSELLELIRACEATKRQSEASTTSVVELKQVFDFLD